MTGGEAPAGQVALIYKTIQLATMPAGSTQTIARLPTWWILLDINTQTQTMSVMGGSMS